MKDLSTQVPPEEFRKEVRACLHQAALVNYTRVSAYAGIEGAAAFIKGFFVCMYLKYTQYCFLFITPVGNDASPETKLSKLVHLAELCIDLLHQNEEHHAEVSALTQGGAVITEMIGKYLLIQYYVVKSE